MQPHCSSLKLLLAIGLAGCAVPFGRRPSLPPATHGVEYRGGQWFDGTRFVSRTMYVANDGTLRLRAPVSVDSVVDLAGGFVIPPFGDAHQHLVDPRVERTIAAFLRDGVFYVKDQSNAPFGRRAIDRLLNRPTAFDYISANQGWTSPGGHPVEVVRRGAAMGGSIAAFVRDSLDPGLVNQVQTEADVAQRWGYFIAGNPPPDFVKVYLFFSDEHDRRRGDARYDGNRGIDPSLVPAIVARARATGLKVSAHVFTAADFRAAVRSGVDQIAHLPGARGADPAPFLLTDADAKAAAESGVTVVTTVTQHGDSATTDRIMKEQYAHNITVLRRHNVPLLLGSDVIGGTAASEAAALARSGLFTNLELLRMWSVETPRSIFPRRKIGLLDDGYEASFLVLHTDPLTDFKNTRAITRRVKQGVTIASASLGGR